MLRVTKVVAFVCAVCLVGGTSAFADTRPYYDWAQYTVPNYSFESGRTTLGDPGADYVSQGSDSDNIAYGWDLNSTSIYWSATGRCNPADYHYPGATTDEPPPHTGLLQDLPSYENIAEGYCSAYAHWGTGTWNVKNHIHSTASLGTFQVDTDYELKVAVGTPLKVNATKDTVAPVPDAYVGFSLGGYSGVHLGTFWGGPGLPARGTWREETFTLTNETVAAQGYAGSDMRIDLDAIMRDSANGPRRLDFDNVRLREHRLAILGDANVDKIVDTQDFSILKANFGSGTLWGQGDFNDDLVVDVQDFSTLKGHFGETYTPPGPAPAPVPAPEPGTMMLLALGSLTAFARRRRR